MDPSPLPARTRTRSFVQLNSPRKLHTSSPLKHKYPVGSVRHPPKRRRLGSSAFAFNRDVEVEGDEEAESEDEYARSGGGEKSRRGPIPLSSEIGLQTINTTTKSKKGSALANGKNKKAVIVASEAEEEEEEESPRKRKRGEREASTSSWVNMEDEEEPDFIAESDQNLLQEAPAHMLRRLRKAELVRLWKVAGMWTADDDDGRSTTSTGDEDDNVGLGKKELVDGILSARKPQIQRKISGLPPSPRRKELDSAVSLASRRSASTSMPVSSISSSEGANGHRRSNDATPKAAPRTRSRVRERMMDGVMRTTPRRVLGGNGRPKGRDRVTRLRSQSMGGDQEHGRKARFSDEVKSPAGGLLSRRPRRPSTVSSAYTTTDVSDTENRPAVRRTHKGGLGFTPVRKTLKTKSSRVVLDVGSDSAEETPLVQRLRSRDARDASSEMEADAEEDTEEEAEDGSGDGKVDKEGEEDEAAEEDRGSPVPRRTRSKDQVPNSDISMLSRRSSRILPSRGAKQKAIDALKGGESETENESGMDMDGELQEDGADEEAMVVSDGEGDGDGAEEDEDQDIDEEDEEEEEDADEPSRPLTRAQLKAQITSDPLGKRRSPGATDSDDTASSDSSLSSPPSTASDSAMARTRSGRAFGTMQTRRARLRQEAIDDEDMEDEEETEEEDEEEDDTYEADVDLSQATVTSLTRLLRDELVQLCESRGLAVGGTKPQLARALLEWHREADGDVSSSASTSSQATARPKSSKRKIIHAIASNVHVNGKTTPVLLRDHVHASDPDTPPLSSEDAKTNEGDLGLDLSGLGLEDSMIKPNLLQKLEKIGSGGFKDVYVGKLRGRKVAISEFRGHLSEMDIRELKLLAEFSHPNIVKFKGVCIPEDTSQIPCMLVSELCENGDLFDYIRNVPCPPLKRLLGLMLDIARGLEYLHLRKPSIIHRDCKSSNILINRQGQAKVGDFGLARVKHSTRSMIRSLVGTVNWQAPELWHPSPRYDYKVDVFSAAMVYWEMMSGWIGEKKYPWEGHNDHYIYDAVGAKHRRPTVAGLRKQWGSEPVNLMERMWHQDPRERPTMTDVVTDLETLIAEH
ncbi:hypothetical protein P7C73_g5703, partial [Tremellales sp. Uapishka_1]